MKFLLLNVLAVAIACSSLNFTPQNRVKENSQNPLIHRALNRDVPGTDGSGGGYTHIYYDADGNSGHGGDDHCTNPNFIGEYGKIVGTLRYGYSDYVGCGKMDEDWFLFTTPRKYKYNFTFDAPNSLYNYEVLKFNYKHDLVIKSNGNSTKQTILMPGTYYIRIFYQYEDENIDGNARYNLTFGYTSLTPDPVTPATYLDPLKERKEVIVWQNDSLPLNVERWGPASQGMNTGIHADYIDPLYCGADHKVQEQYGLDSVIYIFDKTYLGEIADNCKKLINFLGDIEDKQIKAIKRENEQRLNDDGLSAAGYVCSVMSFLAMKEPYLSAALAATSIACSTPAFIHFFGESWQFIDLNFTYASNNLTVLKENCKRALEHDEYGIRIPRFSRIKTENDGMQAFWETSMFGGMQADDDYYLIENRNIPLQPEFSFTDCEDKNHQCYGTFSFYNDMEDFSSKTNFVFGSDAQQIVGETSGYQTVRALKSISLHGNYKTSFLTGEEFSAEGMYLTARYNDGSEEDIYDLGKDNFKYSFENTYTEGLYPIAVNYKAPVYDKDGGLLGYVAKYKKYTIEILDRRETHYSYASLDVRGSDFTYWNGHGKACYYLNTNIQIPIANANPSIWSTVKCLEYWTEGNLDIYFIEATPDEESGYFNVTIESNNGVGQSAIYIDFSYETIIPLPTLESISVSNTRDEFLLGEEFDYDGLVVTARYTSGRTEVVDNYVVDSSNYSKYTTGEYFIFVSYTLYGVTATTSYCVSVVKPRLESIILLGNYKTTFTAGDAFDYNGLEVLARYEDNTFNLVNAFDVDDSHANMNCAGTYDIFVSYCENGIAKTNSYSITVEEPEPLVVLESITLSGNYKTEFELGEDFSYSGLVVTANYSDGTSEVITDFSILPLSYNSFRPGTYRVVVNYEENGEIAMASYTVTVNRLIVFSLLDSITLSGFHPTAFIRGEEFTYDGLIVTAHYGDGSQATVTDYTVDSSAVDMKKAGTYPVVVIYTEGRITVSATYNIKVIRGIPIPPGGKF